MLIRWPSCCWLVWYLRLTSIQWRLGRCAICCAGARDWSRCGPVSMAVCDDCCCAREYCPANSKRLRRPLKLSWSSGSSTLWCAYMPVRNCSGLKLYSQQIAELEKTILALAQTEQSYELLLQLPGVGQTIALTILYEVGELTRFANVKVFSSYCRVVPGIAQSGNVTRRGRASKQGNHYLKAAFSQAAVHAVRCYPKVRRYYERQLKRHQGRGRQMICYNIIAHKLAQAAFHVLKEQTEYREELLFGR